jgi:hypothetical protein
LVDANLPARQAVHIELRSVDTSPVPQGRHVSTENAREAMLAVPAAQGTQVQFWKHPLASCAALQFSHDL